MRYMVSVGMTTLSVLFLYGLSIVSGAGAHNSEPAKVIYVEVENEIDALRKEVARLRAIADIREVLEIYYPSAPLAEKREVAETIYDACRLYDLPEELVLAVIKTESAFDGAALSDKGALGLMQVLPSTGYEVAGELDLDVPDESALLDRRVNILLGCHYLKKMLDRYERLDHALSAYNAGPGRLDMWLSSGRMPIDYAKQVRENMQLLAKTFFPGQPYQDE